MEAAGEPSNTRPARSKREPWQTQKKPPLAVVFDSSLDGDIDQVLALAMLFGVAGRQQARVASLSTSQFNLRAARFLDLVARFYAGDQPGTVVSRNAPAIGMSMTGPATDSVPPMLEAALVKAGADGRPIYLATLPTLNDTACPAPGSAGTTGPPEATSRGSKRVAASHSVSFVIGVRA